MGVVWSDLESRLGERGFRKQFALCGRPCYSFLCEISETLKAKSEEQATDAAMEIVSSLRRPLFVGEFAAERAGGWDRGRERGRGREGGWGLSREGWEVGGQGSARAYGGIAERIRSRAERYESPKDGRAQAEWARARGTCGATLQIYGHGLTLRRGHMLLLCFVLRLIEDARSARMEFHEMTR